MKIVKPPLLRIGGKGRLSKEIAPIIQRMKGSIYVEPFCGSCAVFWRLWNHGYFTPKGKIRPVLNDADRLLINFLEVIRSYPNELIQQLFFTPYARTLHQSCYDLQEESERLLESEDLSKEELVEIAREFAVTSWQSLSSNQRSWGIIRDVDSGQDVVYRWNKVADRILAATSALRQCYLESRDAIDIIQQWSSKDTIFYCDPPYYDKEKYYSAVQGKDTHSFHVTLAETLNNCSASSVVVSYYPHPVIEELYPSEKWEYYYFNASVSSKPITKGLKERKRNTVKEVLLVRKDSQYSQQQLSLFQEQGVVTDDTCS